MRVEANREIPPWIDRFMSRWERKLYKATDEDEEAWRKFCKAVAEGLSKTETEKLGDVHRRWMEWLLKETREEAAAENERADSFEENAPEWYHRVEVEFAAACAPSINFRALAQSRAGQSMALTFGELVGHEYAAWNPDAVGLKNACERVPLPLREGVKQYLDRMRPQRLRFVDKALALATKQPLAESKQFFRGYSLALQRGTVTETGQLAGETYRTPIYYVLVMFPGFVSELRSVRELFEWLQVVLGKGVLKDSNGQKRVEKVCQHIGLHFGPPGRPPST